MQFSVFIIASLAILANVSAAVTHRPIKIIGYPYIPDLNEDELAGLTDWLQDRFFSDTGRRIQLLFDFTYATDTYTPSLVQAALTSGGYDLQEIDTIILGYLLEHDVIAQIPSTVSFFGYTPQVLKMTSDVYGRQFAVASYTCSNIYYSYDSTITGVHTGPEFLSWMSTHRQTGKYGWTGDLSSEPDLRLQYLDGWRDSHPFDPWMPNGYSGSMSQIDMGVVNNVKTLRDACDLSHSNPCVDGTFYNDPDTWFNNFVSGGSLVLQGFPEYTSEILKRANADPNNPTKLHHVQSALVGQYNEPFLFTDAWVISKANCDSDCMTTANIFLNWQRENWASLISLGKDLSPVRPRFLTVAYQPFYFSLDMFLLPLFAQEYYQYFNFQSARAVGLDTTNFWDTEASQTATLESLITVGYTP